MSNPNEVPCASCNVRRDQHGNGPCPRYVAPPVTLDQIAKSHDKGWWTNVVSSPKWGSAPGAKALDDAYLARVYQHMFVDDLASKGEFLLGSNVIPNSRPLINEAPITRRELDDLLHNAMTGVMQRAEQMIREERRAMESRTELLSDEIKKLKKQVATFNWDPQLHRAVKEKTDYTRVFSDDEDGLEEDYRGWPVPKDKVIF